MNRVWNMAQWVQQAKTGSRALFSLFSMSPGSLNSPWGCFAIEYFFTSYHIQMVSYFHFFHVSSNTCTMWPFHWPWQHECAMLIYFCILDRCDSKQWVACIAVTFDAKAKKLSGEGACNTWCQTRQKWQHLVKHGNSLSSWRVANAIYQN